MIPKDLLVYAQVVAECYEDTSVPTWEDSAKLTHVYATVVDGVPTVNFQGTLDWQEWVNRDLVPLGVESFEHPHLGMLHAGLAHGVFGVLDQVDTWLANGPYNVIGHSKGGGEAVIFAAAMSLRGYRPKRLVAFEPPKVGTAKLVEALTGVDVTVTQTHNCSGPDLVTIMPLGDPWEHPVAPTVIQVPDDLSIVEKHKIPAIIEALHDARALA